LIFLDMWSVRVLRVPAKNAARRLHISTALRMFDEKVAESPDSRAFARYHQNELAYSNYDVNKIDFRTSKDFRGNPFPQLSYAGRKSAITHLTPWAAVYYAHAGMKGNLGTKVFGSEQVRENAAEAVQEVSVCATRLGPDENANEEFLKYLQWLGLIHERFNTHIAEKLDNYPRLKAKFKMHQERPEFLRELLHSSSTKIIKQRKDESGEEIPNTEFIVAKQKMFFVPKTERRSYVPACHWDKDLFEQHGLVRRDMPTFDRAGNLIPLDKTGFRKNDVISLQVEVEPSMYELHFGLRLSLQLAVLLRRGESSRYSAPTFLKPVSPYGMIKLEA